jgi:multiple sugar transport system substrate-binding protein
MKSKKTVSLLLATLLVGIAILSACVQATPAPTTAPAPVAEPTKAPEAEKPTDSPKVEPQKLSFWFNWEGTNADVMKEYIQQFNETNPEIVVEGVFQPYADIMTLLQTGIISKTTPDLVALDLVLIPQIVKTGAVASLDDFVANDPEIKIDDFYPMLANFDVMGGKRYALPVSTNNMQLIWNKDLFEKAGLDPEKAPTSWEEMQAMATQCQNDAEGVVGFEYYTQPTGEGITWQFQVWLWAAGGQFLNAENTQAAFNTPEGLKALTFVSDMLKGNGSKPGPWGLFGDQKACMQLDGSWLFGYRKDAPFKWGIAPIPAPTDGTTASNVGGEHIFMFNESKNKDAAYKFIKFVTSPEIQLDWDKKTGFLPVRKSVAENADYLTWVNNTEPRMLPFVQGMEFAHTRPATEKYNAVSEAFSSEIQKAYLGQVTPEEALLLAETAVNAALQ